MIKKNKVMRGGVQKTWIGVVEGYRPAPGAPPKQRTIWSFGYLEDQEDPEAFMKMVEQFNHTYKKDQVPLRIEAEGTARMYSGENRRYNYGYRFLEAVYRLLDMDGFISSHLQKAGFRGAYSPAEIF